MKATDLIKKLESMVDEYGDCVVRSADESGAGAVVITVFTSNKEGFTSPANKSDVYHFDII